MQTISTIHDKPEHISAFQYLQKNNTQRQGRMCAQRRFICKEMGVKLDMLHCYEHVPRNEDVHRDRTIISDNEK